MDSIISETEKKAKCQLDANIQWCLTFEKAISQITVEDDTPCILHGRLVWQNLTGSAELHATQKSCPEKCSTVSNGHDACVIQTGISSTIGELRQGKINAQLSLEYASGNMQRQIRRQISWNKIAQTPLKPFILYVKKRIFQGTLSDSRTIVLDGLDHSSSSFDQKSLKYKAALAAIRGVSIDDIPQALVDDYAMKEVLAKKEYIQGGSDAKLSLYNSFGEVVASKTITASN